MDRVSVPFRLAADEAVSLEALCDIHETESYENGVLYISIPKAEAEQPKKIEIGSGKGDFLKNLTGKNFEAKIKTSHP